MTHPIYSQATLEALTISELKAIASQLGVIPDGDKQIKQTWVGAIIDYQLEFSPAKVAAMEAQSIPADLVEDLTLDSFGLEIIDLETQTTDIIPHGEIRYWVQRGDEPVAGISTWLNEFVLTSGKSYPTLFDAVTSFIPRNELALAYSDAQDQLRERFANAIDYM